MKKPLKYVDTLVTFAEIPDEITLCINISNCPCHCKGCHSAYLAEDVGQFLDLDSTNEIINKNPGISCIAFMGGDSNPEGVNELASKIRELWNLKIAWYSGRDTISDKIELRNFDFIKIGHYDEIRGPLDNPNTNQILYRIDLVDKLKNKFKKENITSRFWKNNK